ncbi:hypothetical protein CP8484711_2079 [Chlamydia psittaci 84-8471/1]|nr:hypothetical protein CP8484711_2079 [Chlamydia psittaci 84-8471/1]
MLYTRLHSNDQKAIAELEQPKHSLHSQLKKTEKCVVTDGDILS